MDRATEDRRRLVAAIGAIDPRGAEDGNARIRRSKYVLLRARGDPLETMPDARLRKRQRDNSE